MPTESTNAVVMEDAEDELFALDRLIRASLLQDMELEAATVPKALTRYARLNDQRTKDDLSAAMDHVLHRFHNDLHGAFECRYGSDLKPEEPGMDLPDFFAMMLAILANPVNRS